VPSGGSLQESGWEKVLAQLDRRTHHSLPEVGDAPAGARRAFVQKALFKVLYY
jgi:hypothetical protein